LARSSSHSRGRSAPPPINDSPWDAEPEPMAATALPSRRKPVPRQDPDADKASSGSQVSLASNLTSGPFWSYAWDYFDNNGDSNLTPRRTAVPEHEPSHRGDDAREQVRVRDIESLASALMTVDNGFEDQWWYQGPRYINAAGDLGPPVPARRGSTASDSGHIISTIDESNLRLDFSPTDRPRHSGEFVSISDIVSPISDTASPSSIYS
jgi:hypothetical protein